MRCVLLCILEAVGSELCSLEVQEVLDVPEVIRSVLPCILEDVEGRLCLLGGAGGVAGAGDVGGAGSAGDAGGNALCATLYAGGCGGWGLLAGGVGGDALC